LGHGDLIYAALFRTEPESGFREPDRELTSDEKGQHGWGGSRAGGLGCGGGDLIFMQHAFAQIQNPGSDMVGVWVPGRDGVVADWGVAT
jgi:hypothetical protein